MLLISWCTFKFLILIIFLLPGDLFRLDLLAVNFLSLCLSERISLELWVGNYFFFQYFKDVTLLSSCLHGFWWEVCCSSYPSSSVGKVFHFPLAALKIFSLSLFFLSYGMLRYLCAFFVCVFEFILFGVFRASWISHLVFVTNFGKFLAISTNIFFCAILFLLVLHLCIYYMVWYCPKLLDVLPCFIHCFLLVF